tara:strand:+ start:22209 stop:23072 length:864 start_codon:yes stop_codon:yes gene_type:complete
MASEDQPPISAKFEISAKAEVKAEIPSNSMGRLVDSLTDAIRPFTEKRGLRADQIRLQREDVLLEIARLARERLRVEGKSPNPVPHKFLIPFMEKASLEELDNSVVVRSWANLLASASTEYEEEMLRFASVLSEMGPRQAKFLEKLANNQRERYGIVNGWEDAPLVVSDLSIAKFFQENFELSNPEKFLKAFENEFDRPGSILVSAVLFNEGRSFFEREYADVFGDDWGYSELYVLDSLAVVRLAQNSTFKQGTWTFACSYVAMTGFGASFYNACSGAIDTDEIGLL